MPLQSHYKAEFIR